MNYKPYQNHLTVKSIYAGWRHYQVNGSDYSPEGKIFEVSVQASKCWLLDASKLYSQIALRECLIAGILCNNSYLEKQEGEWIVIGDPTEGASIAVGSKAKLHQPHLRQLKPKLDIFRFNSKCQYMATLHQDFDGNTIYFKGSVKTVLSLSQQMLDCDGDIIPLNSKLIKLEAESMRKEGLKVFAFAKKLVSAETISLERTQLKSGFIFLGLQGMY
jgi:Ca2+-transporting ATPase